MKLINFNFYRINKIKNKKIVINYINSLGGCKSCVRTICGLLPLFLTLHTNLLQTFE